MLLTSNGVILSTYKEVKETSVLFSHGLTKIFSGT